MSTFSALLAQSKPSANEAKVGEPWASEARVGEPSASEASQWEGRGWEGDDLISSARPLTRLLCSLTNLSGNAEEPADRLGKHHPQLQSPGI